MFHTVFQSSFEPTFRKAVESFARHSLIGGTHLLRPLIPVPLWLAFWLRYQWYRSGDIVYRVDWDKATKKCFVGMWRPPCSQC